jgi:hypothetical protein
VSVCVCVCRRLCVLRVHCVCCVCVGGAPIFDPHVHVTDHAFSHRCCRLLTTRRAGHWRAGGWCWPVSSHTSGWKRLPGDARTCTPSLAAVDTLAPTGTRGGNVPLTQSSWRGWSRPTLPSWRPSSPRRCPSSWTPTPCKWHCICKRTSIRLLKHYQDPEGILSHNNIKCKAAGRGGGRGRGNDHSGA